MFFAKGSETNHRGLLTTSQTFEPTHLCLERQWNHLEESTLCDVVICTCVRVPQILALVAEAELLTVSAQFIEDVQQLCTDTRNCLIWLNSHDKCAQLQ